jgi:dTDP-4-amino-4,6-dideoxygalactose transaminase
MTAGDLPALLGGVPVRPQGPPEWPLPDDAVRLALEAAYTSGAWGKYQGGLVCDLETHLAAHHDVPHVLACGSGTFAVELALRALKVNAGDEVALAAYDYPGNFLTLHALGARPVLIDVSPHNATIDVVQLSEALTPAVRALIVSHLHGGLAPMREIMDLARSRGVAVVEDACQCPGATVEGRLAGSWGDAGVLSFGGSKLLTAGRGGALLTAHASVFQRARTWLNRANLVCPLSELQAAVLLPQLDALEMRNTQSRVAVLRLGELLGDVPGLAPFTNEVAGEAAYYKLGFWFDAERFGLSRERFVAALRAEGIAFDEGFRALHIGRSPNRYRAGGALEHAERAHRSVVILHHPVLVGSEEEVGQVAHAVRKVWAHGAELAAL